MENFEKKKLNLSRESCFGYSLLWKKDIYELIDLRVELRFVKQYFMDLC